jgi:glutamyl-Q tRNA(Asp) synthetase
MGSLVAAVASWLFARRANGRWLVRMEDIDTPRVVPGAAGDILGALERYALEWDGQVVWQSKRTALYEAALADLRAKKLVYDCACSRADSQRAASAPLGREPVYPGTCRNGLPAGKVARAVRFRAADEVVAFDDLIRGRVEEGVGGDFVVRRADGPFAYQLAVVVDDAEQGMTQVVRGADLLMSTPRQIALQRALGFPTPEYAHVPLVVNPDGSKLGKREGALALPTLDDRRVRDTLAASLRHLGIEVAPDRPRVMLEAAERWRPAVSPFPARTAGLRYTSPMDIRNNQSEHRFETTIDGNTAVAEYAMEEPGRIVLTHTHVPEALGGRGIAGELAKAALAYARENELSVVARCSFMAKFLSKHAEYQDLLA